MKKIPSKGGKRHNAGAPKKDHPAKTHAIRLTDEHWLRFKSLGGANWLRWMLSNTGDKN